MKCSRDQIVQKYIKTVRARSNNTKQLFAISFIGTTGVGKSTTATAIGQKLKFYIARTDAVRRFLNKEGIPGKFPDQKLVMLIGKKESEYLYKKKSSHIIDADLIRFHRKAKNNAKRNGAKLLIIHLICPEKIILKRLEKRNKEVLKKMKGKGTADFSDIGFSLSVKEEYFERTSQHQILPLPKDIYFTINTSEDFEKQIKAFILKLKGDKMI